MNNVRVQPATESRKRFSLYDLWDSKFIRNGGLPTTATALFMVFMTWFKYKQ